MSLFETTRWSLVKRAGAKSNLAARAALAELYSLYWEPLYCFLRRRGEQPASAADYVQGYFTHLLEKDTLQRADPERGRFRSYLLTALQYYVGHEVEKQQAQKRGGGKLLESLDFVHAEAVYQREPVDHMTPEKLYERRYAMTLLEQTLETLRQEYEDRGKQSVWQQLHPLLMGDSVKPYSALAVEMKVSESAVKVAVHRLRERFGTLLRLEISRTVETEEEASEELRWLMQSLRSSD
jgi:RNA polymerase sigma factor (sigma-70 family)